eukprot:XP_001702352.1 predicted protein [Chlamydomonas reinhardtii]
MPPTGGAEPGWPGSASSWSCTLACLLLSSDTHYIEVVLQSVQKATATPPTLVDLPGELLNTILSMVDAETLALSVPSVCTTFRAATMETSVWQEHIPPHALSQLAALQALGSRPLRLGHLYLALCGRNLLRNPGFRRECNTPTLWGGGVERTAWVVNQSVGKEVSWERVPQGMTPPPLPRRAAPAAPSAQAQPQQQQQPPQNRMGGPANPVLPHAQPLAPPPPLPYPSCRHAAAATGTGVERPCLAMLGSWSEVVQVVDLQWELQRRGLSAAQAAHLLDAGLGLRLAVHVGSRCTAADTRAGHGGAHCPRQPPLQRPPPGTHTAPTHAAMSVAVWASLAYLMAFLPVQRGGGCGVADRRTGIVASGRRTCPARMQLYAASHVAW